MQNLERLYELGEANYGFVTVADAAEVGVRPERLAEMARRGGSLEREGYGLYRLRRFPPTELDTYRLATLWPYPEEGVLSHETALMLFELSDVNPAKIHMVLPIGYRIRRRNVPAVYEVHHATLAAEQVTQFEGIPVVTAATAIIQCRDIGVRRDLLRQALDQGLAKGKLRRREHERLMTELGFDPALKATR
jgi:predicted transcriptional regulator of viral defense system